MPKIGSFTSWITVEGVELEEYNTEVTDDGRRITCWIPSELGKVSGNPIYVSIYFYDFVIALLPDLHCILELFSALERLS